MKIKTKVKSTVNFNPTKKKIAKANFKSLEHALATLRKNIIQSWKEGKATKTGKIKPSTPGKPPKTWRGRSYLSKYILYDIKKHYSNRDEGIVAANPEESGKTIYQLHEFGGKRTVKFKIPLQKRIRRRSWKTMDERNEKEKKHIKDYYKDLISNYKMMSITRHYPKRPYMAPGLQKNIARLPEIWKTEIKKQL